MEEARLSFAYGSAAQLGERALELWQHVPDAEGVAGMSHVDLLAKTASALRNDGDSERSLAMVNAAIDESDDRTGVRFARLLRDKAYYLANNGMPGSIPLLEQALALVPDGADEVLRGTLLNTLAARLMLRAELDRAIELADQALELARSIDSPAQASDRGQPRRDCRVPSAETSPPGSRQLDLAKELAQGDRARAAAVPGERIRLQLPPWALRGGSAVGRRGPRSCARVGRRTLLRRDPCLRTPRTRSSRLASGIAPVP